MALGRKTHTPLLLTSGGVLLVMTHAVAWRMGSKQGLAGPGLSQTAATTTSSAKEADPSWTPTELLRRGREQQAAILAAEEADRVPPEDPWQTQVDKARVALAADADVDFAKLARDGMAAVKDKREGPSAETAAAFGKWLDMDPDAALDFLGRTSRDQLVSRLQGQVERWLGEGHYRQLAELMQRFPMAKTALLECAQGLCQARGADFLLERAKEMPDREDRMELICHSLTPKQWTGQLAKLAPVLSPKEAEIFVAALTYRPSGGFIRIKPGHRMEDEYPTAEEFRAAGFPADVVEVAERAEARREEYRQEAARPHAEKEAEHEAETIAELEDDIRQRAEEGFETNFHSPLTLASAWPGYTDKLADLRDGRCTADELLAELKANWAAAAKLEKELRFTIFQDFFESQPVEAVRWWAANGGEHWNHKVIPGMSELKPEQMARVLEAFPELAETEDSYPTLQFEEWYDEDPVACLEALRRFPNVELRDHLLELYQMREQEKKNAGGER